MVEDQGIHNFNLTENGTQVYKNTAQKLQTPSLIT